MKRRQRQRGLSVVELLIASLIIAMTLIAVCNLSIGVGQASVSYERTNKLSRNTRMTVEELFFQMRGAESVRSSATINGSAVAIGASTAIVRLPAYNPSNASYFLDDTWDSVILEFDATNRILYETVQPATGSVRPTRTRQVIARDVTTANFTYYARQNFRAPISGIQSFALSAPISASKVVSTGTGSSVVTTVTGLQVFVDGTPTTFVYVSSNNSISLSCPTRGANVQAVYPVSPNLDSGASAPYISYVDFTMTMRDANTPTGAITLQGQSLLRNRRD